MSRARKEAVVIARVWRGWTKPEHAQEYADYVHAWAAGPSGYRATPGNRGAWVLHRDDGERAEIVALSLWDSEEAIKSLIGDDITAPVFYAKDEQLLVARERTVTHYHVIG
jgi:hypothetical protein